MAGAEVWTISFLKGIFRGNKSGTNRFKCHRCPEQIELPDTDTSGINVRVKCKSCGAIYLIRSVASCNTDGFILSSDGKQKAFLCDNDGTPY